MTLQLIGTDALADNAVSTDKSQPFGNIILNSSAAGTDVGDRILLDRTNANGQDAGDAINVEKEILDIEGINVASRKQLKLGAVILESGTTDTVDGDVLLLDSTASGVDEGEMILYNETFNPATFNIGGTFSAGQAIKVNSAGSGFEFGAGGNILQMVTTSNLSNVNTTSNVTTYTTCGNFGPITPKSSDSHLIVVWGGWFYPYLTGGSNASLGMGMKLSTDSGGSTTVGVTGTGNNGILNIQGNSQGWFNYAMQYIQNVFKTSSDAGHPGAGNPVTYYPWVSLTTTSSTPSLRMAYQTSYIMEIEP